MYMAILGQFGLYVLFVVRSVYLDLVIPHGGLMTHYEYSVRCCTMVCVRCHTTPIPYDVVRLCKMGCIIPNTAIRWYGWVVGDMATNLLLNADMLRIRLKRYHAKHLPATTFRVKKAPTTLCAITNDVEDAVEQL